MLTTAGGILVDIFAFETYIARTQSEIEISCTSFHMIRKVFVTEDVKSFH